MKRLIAVLMMVVACEEQLITPTYFTGNEVVYSLQASSQYNVSGTVTIKEKKGGAAVVLVEVQGTEGTVLHPVHLHLGNLATPGTAIAALLTPLKGNVGKSETILKQLADETPLTYAELIKLNACIKLHLSESGAGRDVILAGVNIGSASASGYARELMAICN